MDRLAIINELRNVITDYLKTKNLCLVDLIYRYEGRNLVLRILLDRAEGGISLEECADLNNDIGRMLDEKDILQQRYILEISSPGLDRPLRLKEDFLRCVNRNVRFFLNEPINNKWELEGVIKKIDNDTISIEIGAQAFQIPLQKINKAKQII